MVTLLGLRDVCLVRHMCVRACASGTLDKEGDALCLSFDGNLICVGFSGGAVVGFEVDSGYTMWKAYHKGAVGYAHTRPRSPPCRQSSSQPFPVPKFS